MSVALFRSRALARSSTRATRVLNGYSYRDYCFKKVVLLGSDRGSNSEVFKLIYGCSYVFDQCMLVVAASSKLHSQVLMNANATVKSVLPFYRREEPSPQVPNPCDTVQQTAKNAKSGKVFPEPPLTAESCNENAQEEQSKLGSRPPVADEAQGTSEASARGRDSNTDIADYKHGNGQRFTHDGSCNIDIPEHRKPLLERKDDGFVKVMDDPVFLRGLLEFHRRILESLQRLSEWLLRPSGLFSNFFCSLCELRSVFPKRKGGRREKATGKGLESIPGDLQESILRRLPFKERTQSKAVSKSCKDLIEGDVFRRSRGSTSGVTALNFFIKHEEWQCSGFDMPSKKWQILPTLACLPNPDPNLFQEYSICGHGGLMCANVSKSSHKEELYVFNILTGEKKELPPLKYSRSPVLLHIWVDSETDSYKVIAAGSASSSGEKDLSRRIEVYDSRTSEWVKGSDIRGPEFGLNEHQVGVCVSGVLYFLMFLDGDDGQKGIVAFDIEKREFLEDRTCAVPFSLFCNTLQLLESSGTLCLFSEQEREGVVEHCIDAVELCQDSDLGEPERLQLRTVVRVKKSGGRGLLVYPEFICVPYGVGKLCVFNTINRDGVVYDLDNGMRSDVLDAPPEIQRGENFFCLNPVSFTLAPNFASKP